VTVLFDRDQVWHAIDVQRTRLTDLLEDLSDAEWGQPSLCAAWAVRDVVAHLTQHQLGLGSVLGMMLRWPGSFDRMTREAARKRAAECMPAQMIAEIRGMRGSRRHTAVVTPLEVLIDILVHSQDIAVPLGRRLDTAPEAAAVACSRVLSMRWPPPLASVRNVRGFRLTATDTSWSTGDGPQVRAPMAALLLVCCGRVTALPQLSGPGAVDLAARLTGTKPPNAP
jgi:uncharacterized protein (TIGR03083 family)